ncbi:MAG: sulfatase [Planctomycetes bacterium]|nr:sulfatase [Planctomycetota bacterium]
MKTRWAVFVLALNFSVASAALAAVAEPVRPNFVLVFIDNLGNGDFGCTGSTLHRTPHIDRLAATGTRFTSFYVASGVCTPSRAALMTGCYPRRVNLHVNSENGAVLRPVEPKGLNPDEVTIAETLGTAGYATGMFGKWHLGDQPSLLPTRQGFETFFGIPYSDDMTRDHRPDVWPELPLMRGEQVIEAPVERNTLVKRCTEAAIAFIEQNRQRPFFVYLPQTMPGSTAHPFSSSAFRGHSRNGEYGDAVEELDWSIGELMSTLDRLDLTRRTLVLVTSDNGAVERHPRQGSCAPYRGWGYDTSEGAMRVPCLASWPDHIPAGRVCDELCSTMDLLPTFAKLADAPPPSRPIDGHDIRDLLLGQPGAQSPWDAEGFGYYRLEQLQAVRSGPWKLYLPLDNKYVTAGRKTARANAELYNVRDDVGETREASKEHPDVVVRLSQLAERIRGEIGDMDRPGRGERPAGWSSPAKPLTPRQAD